MDERVVILRGLPFTCNPVKMKLHFESECQVHIESINIHNTFAEVKFTNVKDCNTFRMNLPRTIKFGNDQIKLSVLESRPTSTEPDLTKYQVEPGFTKPETWSTLRKLPYCKRGLLVQPMSKDTMPKDVKMYFQDNLLSCGGQIKVVIPMTDGIFIIFEDEAVAEKVWNSRPHRIKNKRVHVFLKDVPPKFGHQLIVKPGKAELNEEKLKVLLEQCSIKDVPLKTIKAISKGMFHVAYEEGAAKDDIQCIVDEFQSRNPSINISFIRKTDCIIVGNLPPDVSDHEVKMLFENSAKSGGGPVTRIDRVENEFLLVYFSSYKDAGAVCDKSAKKNLLVFGRALEVHPYFQNISERRLEKPNQLDELIKPWLARKGYRSKMKTVDLQEKKVLDKNLDFRLLRFFFLKQDHIMQLNQAIEGIAEIYLSKNGIQILFKLIEEEFQAVVLSEVEKFLEAYQVKTSPVNDKSMRQIIDSELSEQCDRNDMCCWYSDSGNDTLIIAGVKEEVDSFATFLQSLTSAQRLTLGEANVRWLVETDTLQQLKKDHKAIVGSIQSDVLLRHDDLELEEAKQAVEELLKKMELQRFVPKQKSYVTFLSDGKFRWKVVKNVDRIFKRNKIPAVLVADDDTVSIFGPPNCSKEAGKLLNKELAVNFFNKATPGLDTAKLAATWNKILSFEEQGKIKTIVKENGALLVGFREIVAVCMDQLAQSRENFTEEIIPMDQNAAQHMFCYEPKCSAMCKACDVVYAIGDAGITLKGERTSVNAVTAKIKVLGMQIATETSQIKHPTAADFFYSNKGRQLLSTAGEAFRVTLTISSKEKPQAPSAIPQYGSQGNTFSPGTAQGSESPISMSLGPLKVTLKKGDITEDTNDVIVNSASLDFDLSVGAISRTIVEKGGPDIQEEAQKFAGDLCKTTSGKLKCKAIIHVILPADLREMEKVITNVLFEADHHGFFSISIPAIGTGIADIDIHFVARMMYRGIKDFVKKPLKIKHLKILDIVLYDDWMLTSFKEGFCDTYQTSGKKTFRKENLKAIATQSLTTIKNLFTSETEQKLCIFRQLTVSVCLGDITAEVCDAIVNSANFKSGLHHGMVSKKILAKGGKEIQSELDIAKGKHIRVTSGGGLKCRIIIHIDFDHDPAKIGKCLSSALEVAECNRCTSISIPAIGTGHVGLAECEVARKMSKAIQNFDRSHPHLKYLSKVNIIIFDEQVIRSFQDAFFGLAPSETEFSVINEVQDTGVTIQAFSFDKDIAKEALHQIKMEFRHAITAREIGILPVKERNDSDCGSTKYSWKYKEKQGEWQTFNSSDCELLEKFYQEKPRPEMENFKDELKELNFKGELQVINFHQMRLGDLIEIRRTPLAGHGIRDGGPSSSSNMHPRGK